MQSTQNWIYLHAHEHAIAEDMLEKLLGKLGLPERAMEFILHFAADGVKMFLILAAVILAVSFVQTYIDFDKMRKGLARLNSLPGYLCATALGMLSPFCSCTIIPVLIGFLGMGLPLTVCMVFYTSASLLNLTAVLALSSVQGIRFTAAYAVMALAMIAVSAIVVSLFGGESSVKRYLDQGGQTHSHGHSHHHGHGEGCPCGHDHGFDHRGTTLASRLRYALARVGETIRETWLFLLLGVLLSSAMLSFLPAERLSELIAGNRGVSVLLAGLIGAPMHSDVLSVLPVLSVLREISPTVCMTFVLALMGTSVPGVVLLSRALRWRLIAVYSVSLVLLAMALGPLSAFFL